MIDVVFIIVRCIWYVFAVKSPGYRKMEGELRRSQVYRTGRHSKRDTACSQVGRFIIVSGGDANFIAKAGPSRNDQSAKQRCVDGGLRTVGWGDRCREEAGVSGTPVCCVNVENRPISGDQRIRDSLVFQKVREAVPVGIRTAGRVVR